jgi:hypothetical protein
MVRRAAWILVALVGCQSNGQGDFGASDVYYFQSLPRMVAKADLVISGSVQALQSASIGPPGEEAQFTDAIVTVEDRLRGSTPATVTVRTVELQDYEVEWRQEGERILAFLVQGSGPDAGVYGPLNSQAVFILEGDRVEATVADEFAEEVAGMTFPQLRGEITQANRRAERGEVQPVPPFGGA